MNIKLEQLIKLNDFNYRALGQHERQAARARGPQDDRRAARRGPAQLGDLDGLLGQLRQPHRGLGQPHRQRGVTSPSNLKLR